MQNQIPKNWQKVKLGDLLKIKHGYAFKGEYFSEKGKHILLTPGNFSEKEGLKFNKTKYYNGPIPPDYVLHHGDLLVVMTDVLQTAPYLGAPGIIDQDNLYLHNQRLGLVTNVDIKKANKDFLYWLFQTNSLRHQIRGSASGSTVKHTAPERIYSCETIIPKDVNTQKQIASALSAFDDNIEVNNKIAKTLEEMAQALFKEWFVCFRFPGYEKVEFVDSELGKIPISWRVGKLSEIADVIMGQSPASEFYNQKNVGLPFHQGVTNFGRRFPNHEIYCTQNNRIAEERDLLFSVRAPVGRLNIADIKISLGRGVAAIRHRKGYQSYLYYLLKRLFIKENSLGGGSVFPSVTKGDMESMKMIIPAEELVKMFEKVVSEIDRKIEIAEKENLKLAALRDLLLPKLMKGEIRV